MQEIAKVAASERREPTIEPEPATAAPTDKKDDIVQINHDPQHTGGQGDTVRM